MKKLKKYTIKDKIGWCEILLERIDVCERNCWDVFLCSELRCINIEPEEFPEFVKALQQEKSKYPIYDLETDWPVWDGGDYKSRRKFIKNLIKYLKSK